MREIALTNSNQNRDGTFARCVGARSCRDGRIQRSPASSFCQSAPF